MEELARGETMMAESITGSGKPPRVVAPRLDLQQYRRMRYERAVARLAYRYESGRALPGF